jgi:hypothetical protein
MTKCGVLDRMRKGVRCSFDVAGKDGNLIDVKFRVTDVLRKAKGKWLIVHEHVSVPVDLATGKADLASKFCRRRAS